MGCECHSVTYLKNSAAPQLVLSLFLVPILFSSNVRGWSEQIYLHIFVLLEYTIQKIPGNLGISLEWPQNSQIHLARGISRSVIQKLICRGPQWWMLPLTFWNLGEKSSFICFAQSVHIFFEILPIILVYNSLINQIPREVQDIPFNLTYNPPRQCYRVAFWIYLEQVFSLSI